MLENQELEPISIKLDEVWFSHANVIRKVAKNIARPKTFEGEHIAQEFLLSSRLIQRYSRLYEVLEALIALIEFDEIGKFRDKNFFTDPTKQRIVLKSFGLLVEEIIQYSYSQEENSYFHEEKTYDDYRPFFNSLTKSLKDLDKVIKKKGPLPNLIDSLVLVTEEGIKNIAGVINFKIFTMVIRKRIKEFLPKLADADEGKIMAEIESKIIDPFPF